MKQMIYISQPFGFDSSVLAGILMQARRNNRRNDITGALICRRDMYVQLVEGPSEAIDTLFDKISHDDRHSNVRVLLSETVPERMFPEWAMLDDGSPSMTWSREEIEGGAIEEASPSRLREMFRKVADHARDKKQGETQ